MIWPRLTSIGLAAALAAAASGCVSHRAWTHADAWYREAPPTLTQPGERIDETTYVPVIPARQAEAQAMLTESAVVSLTPEEAAAFSGADRPPHHGMQFYLVRAVYLNEETGGYLLRMNGSALLVHHACLGRSPVPMKRSAIVVELSRAPTDVYATCSMDE